VTGNLSLTPGNTTESTAKTAPQQKPRDSLAQVVLESRRALDFCQPSKEASVLWPPPPAVPGLTLSGKLKLSYVRSLAEPSGLRR